MRFIIVLSTLVDVHLILRWSTRNSLIWSWFMLHNVIYFYTTIFFVLLIFCMVFLRYIYKIFFCFKLLLRLLVKNHLTFPEESIGIDLFLLVYFSFFEKLSGLTDSPFFLFLFRQSPITRSCLHHMEHLKILWIISCIYSTESKYSPFLYL